MAVTCSLSGAATTFAASTGTAAAVLVLGRGAGASQGEAGGQEPPSRP